MNLYWMLATIVLHWLAAGWVTALFIGRTVDLAETEEPDPDSEDTVRCFFCGSGDAG